MSPRNSRLNRSLEKFSDAVQRWSGTSAAFLCAFGIVAVWLITGPLFHWSDTWQLVINTATTVATFLMVFLIQRAQNKGVRAIYIKLNELIASSEGASNRLIEIEDLSEEDLEILRRHFHQLVEMAKSDLSLTKSHSVEEATQRHRAKLGRRHRPVPTSRRGGRNRRGKGGGAPRGDGDSGQKAIGT